ncbi:MAG: T9SS type A sorting domain-containing protein, partial [Chitinophagales bacterium]
DILVSIEALLNEEEPGPLEDATGYFTAFVNTEDCVSGVAGETVVAHVGVQNLDTVDSYLEIIKMDADLPDGWLTSLCTDVCYPPDINNTNYLVEAGDTGDFSVYFYTTPFIEAEGTLTLLVRNYYNTDNLYILDVHACVEAGEVTFASNLTAMNHLLIFPSPANDYIQFVLPESASNATTALISDIFGRTVVSESKEMFSKETISMDVEALQSGMYFLEVWSEKGARLYASPFVKK